MSIQWKNIYAKIVCAIHQNYLSLKKLIDTPNFASAFNGRIDKAFMHFVAQNLDRKLRLLCADVL